jgi:glycosyltransferase 2 family protein
MDKQLWAVLRWLLSLAAVFYVGRLFFAHWHTIHFADWGLSELCWFILTLLLGLIAQICATCLWGCILRSLQSPVSLQWSFAIVSQNQLGKYLPGSVWHILGRVQQSQQAGIPVDTIALSLILEPLFFIVGSLFWTIGYPVHPLWEGLLLLGALIVCYPGCFNLLYRLRGNQVMERGLTRYPLQELLIAIIFMGLRCGMFLAAVQIFQPIDWKMAQILIGGFSFAWITRVISPTPAGLGIFEFTILQTLGAELEQAILLGSVAVYRIVTLGAEVILAAIAYSVPQGLGEPARPHLTKL